MNKCKIFSDISLSNRCLQTVLGGSLGDGSLKIQKSYRNARFQMRHSIVQEEYLEWKHKLLHEISLPNLQLEKPDGFSKKYKKGFQSHANIELTKIHTIICKHNQLDIRLDWLDALDEFSLLIWWLDDGSLVSNGKQGCISTDGFSLETIEILQQYLAEKWGINTKIYPVKGKKKGKKAPVYKRLYLNNTELRKLFSLIMPHLEVATMVYKFTFKYKNVDYRERWVCTMKRAMPDKMHQHIDAWYKEYLKCNK